MVAEVTLDFAGMNETESGEVDKCLDPSYTFADWLKWSQAASWCIIGIFVILQRRRSLCLGCTFGSPGVIYPVNLVDAYSDRFTFASAFCSTLKCVLDLFSGVSYFEIDTTNVPDMWKGTVDIITLAINVLLVCVAFYPIFLCLSTRFRVLGNAIGLVYTAYWAFYYTYGIIECQQTTRVVGVTNLYLNGPVIVCYFILLIRFTWGLSMIIMKRCTRKKTQQLVFLEYTSGSFADTHYYEYVRHLLTAKDKKNAITPSKLRNVLHKFYKSVPGFKYSRRFVSTIALSSLAVYQVWIVYVSQISDGMQAILVDLAEDEDHSKTIKLINQTFYYSPENILTVFNDSFIITSYVAMGITVVFIVRAILSYRQHTLMMYKGDYSFCPNEPFPNWRVIVSGFRYTGYHIAYTIWGCFLLHFCMWASVLFCIFLIIYPFRDGRETLVTMLIKDYGLTLIGTYIFYYSQALSAFLFFLQNYGNGVLGLDNRRYFHNATYVLTFYNVVIGLASCLMRILKSIIFGLYYLGRLDRCLLMRGWELWDTGYRAYLGFLRLEIVHTHPVMISFCHFLYTDASIKRPAARTDIESHSKDVKLKYFSRNEETLASTKNAQQRRRVARNRWFVAVTLIRNKELISYRSPEKVSGDVDLGNELDSGEQPEV